MVVELSVSGSARPGAGTDTLEVLTWNVGYAGLGPESDFRADGGKSIRAPSRSIVERNLRQIIERLRVEQPDVALLQELARASFVTRRVDVLAAVEKAMDGYEHAFSPLIQITRIPLVGRLEVGQGTFSARGIVRAARHALPSTPWRFGITVQHFNVLESRLPGDWVVFNVHLSAFDDGALRREHLAEVVRLLEREYEAGKSVVAGGDWNLRLAATLFPYTTDEQAKSWLLDLPAEIVPAGWQWAVDARTPTNRTLEQPYRPGVNYTSVIDGFLVSPNVEILKVETLDLDFASSDHNPVRTRLRRTPD